MTKTYFNLKSVVFSGSFTATCFGIPKKFIKRGKEKYLGVRRLYNINLRHFAYNCMAKDKSLNISY